MCPTLTVSGKPIEVESGSTIEAAVRKQGLVPDAFIYIVDGRPVPMDTPIEDMMTIKAIKVASGG